MIYTVTSAPTGGWEQVPAVPDLLAGLVADHAGLVMSRNGGIGEQPVQHLRVAGLDVQARADVASTAKKMGDEAA
jgi:hypothetical protein